VSPVTPTLQAFFTDRLIRQRQVSAKTIESYRDTLRLLLGYVHAATGKQPATLGWDDLGHDVITGFLDHLEAVRGNTPRTRNLRLTAIRSLFRYAALRHPEHAALISRVLAIPAKRYDKPQISFLTGPEAAALAGAPGQHRWEGRRDRALIVLALQAGLRVSEITSLSNADITLGTGAHVSCTGKGRKKRAVPLTKPTQAVLRPWMDERGGRPDDPLFPTRTGRRLSRDAVERRITIHAATAAAICPTLAGKKLHPHVLRHTCAMDLLRARVDTAVIALWLGHADIRSTDAYIHADMTIKERALTTTTPLAAPAGRYQPSDALLAFLESL
jgi:site-specific recombinase XerD